MNEAGEHRLDPGVPVRMEAVFKSGQLKRYSLELYAHDAPDQLLWKLDDDEPFTPMARGDRLLAPETPGARSDEVMQIESVEHVLWTAGERVRFVTQLQVRTVPRA